MLYVAHLLLFSNSFYCYYPPKLKKKITIIIKFPNQLNSKNSINERTR